MRLIDTINILCATDNRYAPYCGIMLTSLFESNSEHRFEVFVLNDGSVSENNRKKFLRLEEIYHCSIHLIQVDNALLRNCPIQPLNRKITIPTYYRLIASELLPSSVHKVLYFDCDVIVSGDITPFWNMSLDKVVLVAVKDCFFHAVETTYDRLGYPKEYGYFNAGVLLLNLDFWREHEISRKIIEFMEHRTSEQLWMMDQDLLNAFLYDKKRFISEKYNFQTEFFMPGFWKNYTKDYKQVLLREGENPVVIHYCGSLKPWTIRYQKSPYGVLWKKYLNLSLWKHYSHRIMSLNDVKFLLKKWFMPALFREQQKNIWVREIDNLKD